MARDYNSELRQNKKTLRSSLKRDEVMGREAGTRWGNSPTVREGASFSNYTLAPYGQDTGWIEIET
ncbi:MAG: hypothetical protein QOH41_349 [Blastocatellia bacterium]|jgi:hypothetical protein|nr:hypothetical protein [Blastocatellia bacterium]